MKSNKSKHRANKTGKRIKIRQCSYYEPDFKKAVVLYAEQKSTSEAKRRYGISESNIRRWRRLKNDIIEKAAQARHPRRCKRPNSILDEPVDELYELYDHSNSLDSMPLEQRATKLTTDEPVLQSQPLSPTKLKVTRQTNKPPQPSPKPVTPEPVNEEVCLRWNSHHSNMQSSFPNLLLREQYIDATLVADGQTLKCHRLILSSCSPYFEEVLSGISPYQHPVLFMKDVPFWILKSLCDFMYAGEVHIYQDKLEELLAVAETLKIKGLAGKQECGSEEVKSEELIRPIKEEHKKDDTRDRKKQPGIQQNEMSAPRSSKSTKNIHSSNRRNERTIKEPLKMDNILDPLDLLEPVYEELTKHGKPASVPAKFKESKAAPVRKSLPKKLKKRKLSEEHEESPPPMFLSRKGTRSRPNVKIPKYYHAPYDHPLKLVESPESTIVREPHTHQADPLLQVDEIKAEPLDLEDDVIEIEDNAVEFSDHDVPLQEEEIIGNYDSPIVNINDSESTTGNKDESDGFKKINLVQQPIIMDVHSITEKEPEILKIVDLAELKETSGGFEGRNNDMEVDKTNEDPLNFSNVEHGTDRITIASVESVADETNVGITIASVETVVENPENIEKIEEIVVQTSESLNYKVQVPEINVEESLRIEKSMARVDSLAETEEVVLNVDGDHKEADTQIIKDTNEEMAENKENTLKDSGNEETDTQISEDVDKERKAGMEESMSKERSADTQISEVTNEKEKTERRGDKVHCESENVDQTESVTLENEEDDCTKLGFHIAKVACEQIAENEERKNDKKDFQTSNDLLDDHEPEEDAQTNQEESIENHEEESVTSEVSGPTESQDDRNSVEEVERPSDTVANVTLSEETRIMADSLEELLEM